MLLEQKHVNSMKPIFTFFSLQHFIKMWMK